MPAGVPVLTAPAVVAGLVLVAATLVQGAPRVVAPRLGGPDAVGAVGLSGRVDRALSDAELAGDADRVVRLWAVAVLASGVLGLTIGGAGPAVLLAVAAGAAPPVALAARNHRTARRREEALPVVLDAVARSLRSGGSLLLALEAAASVAPPVVAGDVAAVARSARRFGLDAAIDEWAESRPSPGVGLATAAIGLAASAGGSSARALDGVAATIRQRLAGAAEAKALSAQARLSAMVIALAPVGFAVLGAAADRRMAHVLLRTHLGWALLSAGLVLDAAGGAWMLAIVRRVR